MANNKKTKPVNWDKIKIEYITTPISQRKLAEKYGVPYATLRDRCKNEGWYEEKQNHHSKVVADTVDRIASQQTEQLAKECSIAEQFIELIEKSLQDTSNYDEITTYMGQVVKTGRVDTKAVVNAANAFTKFMDIKMICKGYKTVQEQDAHDIALRKLELEEKRLNSGDNADNTIEIVLSDEVKELFDES